MDAETLGLYLHRKCRATPEQVAAARELSARIDAAQGKHMRLSVLEMQKAAKLIRVGLLAVRAVQGAK